LHRAGFSTVAARRDPDNPSKTDKPGKGHAGDKRVHKGSSDKDNGREPGAPAGKPDANGRADNPGVGQDGSGKPGGGLFSGLPKVGTLGSIAPLPLPALPGVPPLADPGTGPGPEAAPATGPGTTVAISLGNVRQAVSGHAIAAKATAMTIAITKGPDRQAYGDSAPNRSGAVLDLDMGLLEVAAVAPEPAGAASGVAGGDAGGLPITGPRVDVLALAGVALLIGGAAALIFGMRGRPRP
jgi:hypothetical protein